MKVDVVTIFPKMIEEAISYGVVGQAIKKNIIEVRAHTPRVFTSDVHQTIDDRPFGGGDGMIMLAEPLLKCVETINSPVSKIIYLSPQGSLLNHSLAKRLSTEQHLILVCGRYGGIDQRAIKKMNMEEISVGDYVLSGGELAGLVLMDAVFRHVPHVLGHAESVMKDSFASGLLEAPHFSRPQIFEGMSVPPVLLSGHHQKIEEWNFFISLLVTMKKRKDLLKKYLDENNRDKMKILNKMRKMFFSLTEEEKKLFLIYDISEHDFEEI